jgi:hypothetical protein
MKQLAHSVWRPVGRRWPRSTGSPVRSPVWPTLRKVQVVVRNAAAGLAVDQVIGRLGRLLGEFHETMNHPSADP